MISRILLYCLGIIMIIGLFSSCATIVGGSNYYARVQVKNVDGASIYYKGMKRGEDEASFMVPRKEANRLSVTLKKDGCEDQVSTFSQRTFRGWAFTGSLVFFTGVIPGSGIPLPWGIALDGATGAWWKPDVLETGVQKVDYKHFTYQIEYKGCKSKKSTETDYVRELETDTETETKSKSENQTDIEEGTDGFETLKAKKLRELKKLYDEGVLTEEEFKKEKQKILDGEY